MRCTLRRSDRGVPPNVIYSKVKLAQCARNIYSSLTIFISHIILCFNIMLSTASKLFRLYNIYDTLAYLNANKVYLNLGVEGKIHP